jgi:glutamine transport system substrate-binding protein
MAQYQISINGHPAGTIELEQSDFVEDKLRANFPAQLQNAKPIYYAEDGNPATRTVLESTQRLSRINPGIENQLQVFTKPIVVNPPLKPRMGGLLIPLALAGLVAVVALLVLLNPFRSPVMGTEPTALSMTASSEPSPEAQPTAVASSPITTPEPTAADSSPSTAPEPTAEPSTPSAEPEPTAEPTLPPEFVESAEQALQWLQTNGLIAGVRHDAPPFGAIENPEARENYTCDPTRDDPTFQPVGLDIGIVQEFARRWKIPPDKLKLRCVPGGERVNTETRSSIFDAVPEIGLGVFSLSDVSTRCEIVTCSKPYTEDLLGLVVRNDIEPPITSVCDLDGQKIAVLGGTSAHLKLVEEADRICNFTITPTLELYTDRQLALEAVADSTDKIVAYSTNVLILEAFLRNNPISNNLHVVDPFVNELFVLAVPRGVTGLEALVNLTLEEMKADGSYDALYKAAFGCDATPFYIRVSSSGQERASVRVAEPVPDPCPSPVAPTPTPATATSQSSFKERPLPEGRTLRYIAREEYGDSDIWRCIQIATGEPARDEYRIPTDTILKIPSTREECERLIRENPAP